MIISEINMSISPISVATKVTFSQDAMQEAGFVDYFRQ
jgi:hypothetical protein